MQQNRGADGCWALGLEGRGHPKDKNAEAFLRGRSLMGGFCLFSLVFGERVFQTLPVEELRSPASSVSNDLPSEGSLS